MSLVSNFIGAIPANFNSQGESQQNYDLGDNTFSNLLEKQIRTQNDIQNNLFSSIGVQTGIGDGINIQDLISTVNNSQDIASQYTEIKDRMLGSTEMIAYLTKPFDTNTSAENNHGLINFAKKQAANFYNKCASNVITDLTEFVEDTLKLQ